MSDKEEKSNENSSRSDEVKNQSSNEGQIKVERIGMALAGNIDPFVPGTNFESYEDRINQFFEANDIKEAKKTSMFITLAGESMYEILKSLTLPQKPSQKSYKDILKLLRSHFTPKSNKRAERYKFNKVVQETGESISEFIVKNQGVKKIQKFLMYHNNSPSTVTGKSPSELIFAFKPRTLLDLINFRNKKNFDDASIVESGKVNGLKFGVINSKYVENQKVMYLNHFKSFVNWIPATIMKVVSKFTYLISINSHIRFVHENQLKASKFRESGIELDAMSVVTEPVVNRNDFKEGGNPVELVKKDDIVKKPILRNRSISESGETVPHGKTVTFESVGRNRSVSESEGEVVAITKSGRIVKRPDYFAFSG